MEKAETQTHFIGVDALFQYIGSGVQFISGLVFYLIAVRLFSTTSIGAIALFVAIIGLFNIIFSFGLATASQHFTSYDLGKRDYASVRKTVQKIILYGFCLSVAGLASLEVLSGELSKIFLHSIVYTGLVRLLGIVLFGNIMFSILNGIMLGIQQFRLSAIMSIVIWVSYYLGAILFAVFLRSIETIVFGWIIGIFLGVSIELIVILSFIRKYLGVGISPSNLDIFSYSFPVLLSGIISYGASYADRLVVSGFLNLSTLGVYNFALLIATAISFLAFPFNNILMPKFSEFFGKGDKVMISTTAEVSATLLSYFYVPSALGIAALAPMLLEVLGGHNYIPGEVPLMIIMFATSIFVTQNILAQAVASVRKTKLFIYSSGFSLAGNVILSIILIPHFGLVGAALAYSSVYGITFFILYYFATKESLITLDGYGIFKVWISALLMYVVVSLFSRMTGMSLTLLPIYILIGIVTYIGLTKAAVIFKKENKELILSLFPSRLKLLKKILLIIVLH